MHNLYNSKTNLVTSNGNSYTYYSLESLEKAGFKINNLPVSLRIILESLLRNYDDKKITEETVKQLASWMPNANRVEEIPFVVSRVILQDFTGVPLLCDLAAMRDCAINLGQDPKLIEPLVPVDLVVDHSVQVDYYRIPNALKLNMEIEFRRNIIVQMINSCKLYIEQALSLIQIASCRLNVLTLRERLRIMIEVCLIIEHQTMVNNNALINPIEVETIQPIKHSSQYIKEWRIIQDITICGINATDECPICFDCIKVEESITTNCKHAYCLDCIKGFTTSIKNKTEKPICPMCRSDIIEITISNHEIYQELNEHLIDL